MFCFLVGWFEKQFVQEIIYLKAFCAETLLQDLTAPPHALMVYYTFPHSKKNKIRKKSKKWGINPKKITKKSKKIGFLWQSCVARSYCTECIDGLLPLQPLQKKKKSKKFQISFVTFLLSKYCQNQGQCSEKFEGGLSGGWFLTWWKYRLYSEKAQNSDFHWGPLYGEIGLLK